MWWQMLPPATVVFVAPFLGFMLQPVSNRLANVKLSTNTFIKHD